MCVCVCCELRGKATGDFTAWYFCKAPERNMPQAIVMLQTNEEGAMCDLCKFALSLTFSFFFHSLSSPPSPQCLTLKWHRNQTISRREIKVLLCPLALVNMATMFENVAFIIQVLPFSHTLSVFFLLTLFLFFFHTELLTLLSYSCSN